MKQRNRFMVLGLLAVFLCLALVACGQPDGEKDLWQEATFTENMELGSGANTVYLEVSAEEKAVTFTVHTDRKTLGEALTEHSLIAGEQGAYGLYVKTVNGITADYDADGSYWAFSKNGEGMLTGVDGAEVADGDHYELVYTK